MFVVLLRFAANKGLAGEWMAGHKLWLQRGFDDGVFLLAGSLQASQGGAVLAHNTSLTALQSRLSADPFVAHQVVSTEVIEITPSRVDERLQTLLA
jgi:uncharacterized protein YciI